jgi:hypothetical protein
MFQRIIGKPTVSPMTPSLKWTSERSEV